MVRIEPTAEAVLSHSSCCKMAPGLLFIDEGGGGGGALEDICQPEVCAWFSVSLLPKILVPSVLSRAEMIISLSTYIPPHFSMTPGCLQATIEIVIPAFLNIVEQIFPSALNTNKSG